MNEQHFTVTAGSVGNAEEADLCCALLKFAAASNSKCVFINALHNDIVYCYATEAGARSPIARNWNRGEEHPTAIMQLWSAPVQNEIVRGVVIITGHEQWPLLWNCSAGGAFVSYLGFEIANADSFFADSPPAAADTSISNFVHSKLEASPKVVSAWTESFLRITVPDATADVTHAQECLQLLQQQGTGVLIEEQQTR